VILEKALARLLRFDDAALGVSHQRTEEKQGHD
jgi:hypothetical protein